MRATARENRPTEGAVHEVPAKGPTRMIQGQTDIGPQLDRLDAILDRILRTLAPLVGGIR